jgi:hypothetical protein
MCADSESEKESWIGAIGKYVNWIIYVLNVIVLIFRAIVKHSSMLINDEGDDDDNESDTESLGDDGR